MRSQNRLLHCVRRVIPASCGIAMWMVAISAGPGLAADLTKIQTIVVIYAENRSFDHLYGMFPGANGSPTRRTSSTRSATMTARCCRPARLDAKGKPNPRFPQLPNAPFRIDAPPVNRRRAQVLPSPIHAYYHNIEQINGGQNNMFAAMSTVGGYTMGYFDGSTHEAVAVGEGIHARRQFLHGRVRRFLSQSPVADLRLHAACTRTRRRRCARGSTTRAS